MQWRWLYGWLLVGLVCGALAAHAQEPEEESVEGPAQFEGLAQYLKVEDEEVTDGDIVILESDVFRRSREPYDSSLFGVVNQQPAVAFNVTGPEAEYPVVTGGTVHVNVNTSNGQIESGDLITSSEEAGVGMKATQPGLVLGRALESYNAEDANEVGQVEVAITIHFATILDGQELQGRTIAGRVEDLLVRGAAAAVSEPNTFWRYLIAGLVVIVSVLLGFFVFGRSAVHGVLGVARNPLAKQSIVLVVIFNVLMTVVFAGAGLAAAFIILAT